MGSAYAPHPKSVFMYSKYMYINIWKIGQHNCNLMRGCILVGIVVYYFQSHSD